MMTNRTPDKSKLKIKDKQIKIENAKNKWNVIWTVNLLDKNVLRVLSEMGMEMYRDDADKKGEKRIKASIMREQIRWAASVHNWLNKLAKRNNENLMHTGIISRLLNNQQIEYQLKEGSLKREESKEVRDESRGILIYSRAENSNTIKLDNDEIDFLKEGIKIGLHEVGTSFRMIEIEIPSLMKLTPKYINQLRAKINIEKVTVSNVLYTDEYYARLTFEKPYFLYDKASTTQIRKFKSEDRLVYLMTEENDAKLLREKGLRVYIPHASKLIFKKKDRELVLYVSVPPLMFVSSIGENYAMMSNDIASLSMIPYVQSTFGMGTSKLTRVLAATASSPRIPARATLQKLLMEVDSERKVVTCVLIGNKGSGKTTATKRMVELLDGRNGRRCFRIDSDAPGRWMLDAENKIKVKSFDELLSYNNNMYVSIYEKIIDDFMVKEKLNYISYQKLSVSKKREILDTLKGQIDRRLIDGLEELNEKAFYDMVHEMVPINSILILEAHRITQDAVLGGTDISMLYQGVVDPIVSFLGRPNFFVEMVLHDIYQRDYSYSHVMVNLMEINSVLGE
uniref:Structural protein 4 n=1 Tax=Thaumetopoea pityocampa cypovirus 5 TaxID=1591445 RepID=A0A0B4UDJ4_9REOV|nr:structural protein 4 [Thaumetopoea pityocampa cypovirus 5]